jgi:fumarate hydratase subunit alpha
MKTIKNSQITKKTTAALTKANLYLPAEIKKIFRNNFRQASNKKEKKYWRLLLDNAAWAVREKIPLCQDTGTVITFVKMGKEVFVDGDLYEAINEGIRQAYQKNYFRKSVVGHPLERKNTGDNAPATIHTESAPGNHLTITFLVKGAGAENQSQLLMLPPAAGIKGIKKFVIETVKKGGPSACPPLIVGVGIGGTFETVGILAKKALLRKIGSKNKNSKTAQLEKELLKEINRLGIGLFGLKKGPTALAVHCETSPCHLASLPVAVNLQCHAIREIKIKL